MRRKLHAQRDHVSKRWAKLEREKLLSEARAHHHHQTGHQNNPHTTAMLPAQEKQYRDHVRKNIEIMCEKHRNAFIEGELRALRYKLLPRLEIFAQEKDQWRQELQEWNETNEAYILLGKSRTDLPLFRWPPHRPCFMPPAHSHECDASNGKNCTEGCPGRIGDAMILEMFERARNDRFSWTKITSPKSPERRPEKEDRRLTIEEAIRADRADAGVFADRPASAAADFDDLTDMPGLHINQGKQATHGGEPQAWISHLATAAVTSIVGAYGSPDVSPIRKDSSL